MRTLSALLLALAVLLAPLGGSAADPYVINVILPITGQGAFVAKVELNALSLLEQSTNKAGGIRGRPIHFQILDDQSQPQVSVQLLNGLAPQNPPLVLGSTLAATCNATAAIIKDGPVQFCFSPGVRPADGSYQYSSGVDSVALLAAAARYLRDRGLTKVAALTSNDATGQDADHAIDTVFSDPANRALSLVLHDHFNPTDVNVAAQMTRVKASGATVLLAWTTGAPFGTILRSVRDAGLDIPVLSTPGNALATQLQQYTQIFPKELIFPNLASALPATDLPPGRTRDNVQKFDDAFKAAGLRPSGEHQVWDSIQLAIDALQKLGLDAKPAQVKDYINNLHGWTGINGTYDFKRYPQRGIGIEAVDVQRWDLATMAGVAVSQPGGAALKP